MKKTRKISTLICITLFLITFSALAFAGTKTNDNDWQFNLTPIYVWVVGVEGHGNASDRTVTTSYEYEDVFDLDAAYLGHFEAMHKSNWGFLIDANYIGLTGGQTFSVGGVLEMEFEATIAEFSGLYRITRQNHQFDLIAGVRYVDIDVDVNLTGRPNLEVNLSQNWVDPLIGVRWGWQFAKNWSLSARGDIGGFGVGSDFAWQAIGLVDWQPFEYVSFIAGYRALYEDYEAEDGLALLDLEATFLGPVVGINFRW